MECLLFPGVGVFLLLCMGKGINGSGQPKRLCRAQSKQFDQVCRDQPAHGAQGCKVLAQLAHSDRVGLKLALALSWDFGLQGCKIRDLTVRQLFRSTFAGQGKIEEKQNPVCYQVSLRSTAHGSRLFSHTCSAHCGTNLIDLFVSAASESRQQRRR